MLLVFICPYWCQTRLPDVTCIYLPILMSNTITWCYLYLFAHTDVKHDYLLLLVFICPYWCQTRLPAVILMSSTITDVTCIYLPILMSNTITWCYLYLCPILMSSTITDVTCIYLPILMSNTITWCYLYLFAHTDVKHDYLLLLVFICPYWCQAR